VLIISGWMDGMLLSAVQVMGAAAVMKKPVTGAAWVEKIKEIFSPADGPAGAGT
jgi:hypothetical protein